MSKNQSNRTFEAKTFEDRVSDVCLLLMGIQNDPNANPELVKIIARLNAVCADLFTFMGKLMKATVRFIGGEADQNRYGRDGSRYGA